MKQLWRIILVTLICVLSMGYLYHWNGYPEVLTGKSGKAQTESVENPSIPQKSGSFSKHVSTESEKSAVQLMNQRFYKRLNQKINDLLTSSSL